MLQPRIVFIGAGLIGSAVIEGAAAKLPNADLTLIDARSYFENNTANLRSVVVQGFHEATVKEHSEWLPKNVKLVVGKATEVTKANTVVVDGKTAVPFDFLVIQSGNRYDTFKASKPTLAERTAELAALRAQVKAAKSIIVVGGGQAGVELIAELASEYKDKQLTIVHSHERFVHHAPAKLHNRIAEWLRAHKVTTVLGDRLIMDKRLSGSRQETKTQTQDSKTSPTATTATSEADEKRQAAEARETALLEAEARAHPDDAALQARLGALVVERHFAEQERRAKQQQQQQTQQQQKPTEEKTQQKPTTDVQLATREYRTEKGKVLQADLVLDTRGATTNSEFMRSQFAGVLASNGRIKVANSFLVEGTQNIFAIGDVCNADPCPLAASGQNHVPVVVENLARVVAARQKGQTRLPSLKAYGGSKFHWGPATTLGPATVVVNMPMCGGTLQMNLKGEIKTKIMQRTPGAAKKAKA